MGKQLVVRRERRNSTCSPQEAFHLDTPDNLFKLLHVSLIIPWLHFKEDRRFPTFDEKVKSSKKKQDANRY